MDPSRKDEFIIIVIPVGANWAGFSKTRKSTASVLLEFLSVPVHFISKTQSVIAQSSAENELFASGLGVAEGVHIRFILNGSRTCKYVHIGNADGLFK